MEQFAEAAVSRYCHRCLTTYSYEGRPILGSQVKIKMSVLFERVQFGIVQK